MVISMSGRQTASHYSEATRQEPRYSYVLRSRRESDWKSMGIKAGQETKERAAVAARRGNEGQGEAAQWHAVV